MINPRQFFFRFFGCEMRLNDCGICKQHGVPGKLSDIELELLDQALHQIDISVGMAQKWVWNQVAARLASGRDRTCVEFLRKVDKESINDCAYTHL